MQFNDTITLDRAGIRRTADGYLTAQAKVSRTGIQIYRGAEVGRPDMDTVRVYRPEAEVFAKDALQSYAYKPMTNDHPSAMVDASNWKTHVIGQIGGDVARDGEFVSVPLVMMDGAAIKDWESGKRELSMGYTAELVFGDGITPEGEPYDAMQTALRMNHVALVSRARGGSKLKIGDDTNPKGKSTMSEPTTKTIMVDGLPVVTTDAGEAAIIKLTKVANDANTALADANKAHATALAAKDADLAKKDAEIDELKAKVVDGAALDAMVQARADLIASAKLVKDADYTGKTADDIRRIAVAGKFGDEAVKDKSADYIKARFDIALEDAAKSDPARAAVLNGGKAAPVNDSANAWDAMQKAHLDTFKTATGA